MRLNPLHLPLVLCAVLTVPVFALPPNLVKGGSFDTFDDLRLWTAAYGLEWEGVDAQWRANSGTATVLRAGGAVTQCVAITPGRDYDFGARILVPHEVDVPSRPRGYVQVDFWPSATCSGGAQPLATAQTQRVISSPNGRFTAVSARVFAPEEARSAMVSLFGVDGHFAASSQAILFDDVFLQERGGCVPDDLTLCFGGGRFSATVVYYDAHDDAHQAPAIQISPTSGYFYTYSPDDAELTIKGGAAGSKSFVIGGMTNLRLQIVVHDYTLGQERRYNNDAGHFLSPIADAFPTE